MNNLNLLLIGVITVCGILNIVYGRKIINCYYDTFRQFPNDKPTSVVHIGPYLCTHISYSFHNIDAQSGDIKFQALWFTDDKILKEIERSALLKKRNPNLKIILLVGGWTTGGRIAASSTIENFIQSARKLIKKYNVDGLNLDWGDVTHFGNPADTKELVTLLKETHTAMKSMGKELHVTVFAGKRADSQMYYIPGIAMNVDFINVKAFDLNFRDTQAVGVNSRLEDQGKNNLKSAIKYWLNQGAPASKLVLMLSFYGHVFNLVHPKKYEVQDIIEGPIAEHVCWRTYLNICKNKNSYTYKWSDTHNVPYLLNGTEFISFDNAQSVQTKADLINFFDLGGVMVWSIEADDYQGLCGDSQFPLLNAIKNRIAVLSK